MAHNERGLFKVKIDNGREVVVQQMKINGERWYSTFETGIAYSNKAEIKSCKLLNKTTNL